MAKYNLDALGSDEFETLCQSLAQQIIGPGVRVYGMGKDGARDATFTGKAPYPSIEDPWDGSWIFQVKFHDVSQIGPRSARRQLMVDIDSELSKITEIYEHPCDNFILITNVSLTPAFQTGTKDRIDSEIITKFSNSIRNIHVWGGEEVCRFLDQNPDVRQSYAHLLLAGDVLQRLLGLVEAEETELDELVKLYCQACFGNEESAALDDAGDVEEQPVALQKVFIDLGVTPSSPSEHQSQADGVPEWLRQAADQEDRQSALSYLLDDTIPGLVMVGGPGEGKSTLCQYLAQIHRARLLNRPEDLEANSQELESSIPRLPLRILLRDYAQWLGSNPSEGDLNRYISSLMSRDTGRDVSPAETHQIAKSTPLLLILDGLDEVPEKSLRRRVLKNITNFVSQVSDVLVGDIRVIATTRPHGYSEEFDPSNFLHLTLQKLGPQGARDYAAKWTAQREPNPNERSRILQICDECVEDKVVGALTQTPLQVTILLVIIRARGLPPKQREELFDRYMHVIYEREQKKRPELLRTERDAIYGLHNYLAYILHRRAESDRTAALMDVSEFEEKVRKYILHANPLLTEEELEAKVHQIIEEARLRLILIESPEEGKVGFGLTTTREFFAAAHLVDTAKDTKERDLRFRAIATSPHWRNVALFFSGRVGRTRPGEAASMVDVCREIDTEETDKYLKRGAGLVLEMVDDRVLREPHNEIGAIQYGLTILEDGFISDSGELLNVLTDLPVEYKERVIRQPMEQMLNDLGPDSRKLLLVAFYELFGLTDPLRDAFITSSEFDLNWLRWTLTTALARRIEEPWVADLLKRASSQVPSWDIPQEIAQAWEWPPNYIEYLLSQQLSESAQETVALALLNELRFSLPRRERLRTRYSDFLLKNVEDARINEDRLYFAAVCLLALLSQGEERQREPGEGVQYRFPTLVNPKVRSDLQVNKPLIEKFIARYEDSNNPVTGLLVILFQFLLEPENPDHLYRLAKHSREGPEFPHVLLRILSDMLGNFPDMDEDVDYYHEGLLALFKTLHSEQGFQAFVEESNSLLNSDSDSIENHGLRVWLWASMRFNESEGADLDRLIVRKVDDFLAAMGMPRNVLTTPGWAIYSVQDAGADAEFLRLALRSLRRNILSDTGFAFPSLWPIHMLVDYGWQEEKTTEEMALIQELKHTLDLLISGEGADLDTDQRALEYAYWAAAHAGILTDEIASRTYRITKENPSFSTRTWRLENVEARLAVFAALMRSRKKGVSEIAALSMCALLDKAETRQFADKDLEPGDTKVLSNRLWKYILETETQWREVYIRGLAHVSINWATKSLAIADMVKTAEAETEISAWFRVIEKSPLASGRDKEGFRQFLISILESHQDFPEGIRGSALRRLFEIEMIDQSFELNEETLNLPLAQRV